MGIATAAELGCERSFLGRGGTSRLSEASPIIGRSTPLGDGGGGEGTVVPVSTGAGLRGNLSIRVVGQLVFHRHHTGRGNLVPLSDNGDTLKIYSVRSEGQRVKNNSRKHRRKLILNTF